MRSALFAIAIIVAAFLLTAFVTMHNGSTAAPRHDQPRSTHPVYCQPGPQPDC